MQALEAEGNTSIKVLRNDGRECQPIRRIRFKIVRNHVFLQVISRRDALFRVRIGIIQDFNASLMIFEMLSMNSVS